MKTGKTPPTRRLLAVLGLVLFLGPGCGLAGDGADDPYLGFVEGEFLWPGLPEAGTLDVLMVAEGDRLETGAPIARLDAEQEEAALAGARARLEEARAREQNLLKGLRTEEIQVIEARLEQARANLALAEITLARQLELVEEGAVSEDAADRARTGFEEAQARVRQLQSEIEAARLAARPDEIAAARAVISQAEAQVREAEWRLEKRHLQAPEAGQVFRILHREGEIVDRGQPIISLLPDDNRKIRFFVPETDVAGFAIGDTVHVSCDSCPDGLTARVSFISPEVEFTPPVIFSEQVREKLVYMLEARPGADDFLLPPGLPVDVRK